MGLEGTFTLGGLIASAEYKRADVARFFDITRGHVLAAGPKTTPVFPPEFARMDRELFVLAFEPWIRRKLLKHFAGRIVFIGGGPSVWDVYAPFISHWDITRLPYDGSADRWFNPQWLTPNTGLAGGPKLCQVSHPLQRDRDALPDADAHRRERQRAAAFAQLQRRRAGDARARHAERMAERDRAAIRVDVLRVVGDAELAQHGDALARQRLR